MEPHNISPMVVSVYRDEWSLCHFEAFKVQLQVAWYLEVGVGCELTIDAFPDPCTVMQCKTETKYP